MSIGADCNFAGHVNKTYGEILKFESRHNTCAKNYFATEGRPRLKPYIG